MPNDPSNEVTREAFDEALRTLHNRCCSCIPDPCEGYFREEHAKAYADQRQAKLDAMERRMLEAEIDAQGLDLVLFEMIGDFKHRPYNEAEKRELIKAKRARLAELEGEL